MAKDDKPFDDLGALQTEVLETVWRLDEATVHQVRDRLERGAALAYTTVLSALQKLEKAGWLTHRTAGRVNIYRATRSRRQSGARALRRFVERVFRGDPLALFQHLLDDRDLDDAQLKKLRKMIEDRRKEQHHG